ncbi:hypothetical protein ACEYW6_31475 [Nostoc sp. UIC 10607]
MSSKRDIKILSELFDLGDIKVISHRFHDGIGIILQTESKRLYVLVPGVAPQVRNYIKIIDILLKTYLLGISQYF